MRRLLPTWRQNAAKNVINRNAGCHAIHSRSHVVVLEMIWDVYGCAQLGRRLLGGKEIKQQSEDFRSSPVTYWVALGSGTLAKIRGTFPASLYQSSRLEQYCNHMVLVLEERWCRHPQDTISSNKRIRKALCAGVWLGCWKAKVV